MAKDKAQSSDFTGPLRRLLIGVLVLCLVGVFLVWRIDSPRVERFRAHITDTFVPNLSWAMAPVTGTVNLLKDFESYQRLAQQNRELRSELRRMQAWKEAALQLEQENARLLELNNVRLDPRLTYITGVVLADSGSPFRQSVLINVGARDGLIDGWATMDGIGLVGRISGVADNTARVILLTDASSRIPAAIQPSGQRVIIAGDNTSAPVIDFLEDSDRVRPGHRVISTGDGGVFPAGLLIGQVAADPTGQLRVILAADYNQLEFLRVLRHHGTTPVGDTAQIIGPQLPAPEVTQ